MTFNNDRDSAFEASPDTSQFNLGAAPNLARPVLDLSYRVADHEGQLKSGASVTAAVQSSLSAWTTTATALGALLLAVMAIFATYQVYFNSKMDTKTDALAQKIESKSDALDGKIDAAGKQIQAISSKMDAIPVAVSREIRELARDLTMIARPPVPEPRPPEQPTKP